MIFLEDAKDLKIYNRPFILPMVDKDDLHGSSIFLLTPNYQSSKNVMGLPYMINKKNAFKSYYMEKNINLIISESGMVKYPSLSINAPIYYGDYIEEETLTASKRDEIPSSKFGLPKKRKYPLHDEKHIKSAIRFFNYVDKEDEKELAQNIKKAIKKYHLNVNIGEKNRLSNYIHEDIIEEGYLSQLTMGFRIKPHLEFHEILKKHSYPGILNLIKSIRKKEDLIYLRKDIHVGIHEITVVKERIEKCNKLGYSRETENYYDGIKKKFIDKGVTVKDCEATAEWYRNVALKEVSARIKQISESVIEESFSSDEAFIQQFMNMRDEEVITESSIIEEAKKEQKVPIFIIACDYPSTFGTLVKGVTQSQFNHSAISLTPDLSVMYTYSRHPVNIKGAKKANGFSIESLEMMKSKGARIKVNAIYISKSNYKKLGDIINKYIENIDDTSYGYDKLFKVAFKRDINDKNDTHLICSEFVAKVLGEIGIKISNKNTAVSPSDIAKSDINNKKIVTIFYGDAKDYDKTKINVMNNLTESEDFIMHRAFDYYLVSKERIYDTCNMYSSFEEAMDKAYCGEGVYFVYTISKVGEPILIGTVSMYSNSEDWEWKEQFDVYQETSLEYNNTLTEEFKRKGSIDASYLTKHIKFFGKKGKHKSNKIKLGINKFADDMKDLKQKTNPEEEEKVNPDDAPKILDGNNTMAPKKDDGDSAPSDTKESFLYNIDESYYMDMDSLVMFTEDSQYNAHLRRIFYNERLKQDKEVLAMYDKVKEDIPSIKYTYINMARYGKKNIFYDLSYYNQVFFKNNDIGSIKGLNLYTELLDRLLNNTKLSANGYTRKTVFIPIQDWENNDHTKMWMYRNGFNPISAIYQGVVNNPQKIKSIFKDITIVFLDTNRYFKIDFNNITDFKKFIPKFRTIIDRLQNGQDVDPSDKDDTPANAESKKVIVNNIIDKLEDSGVKIKHLTGEDKETTTTAIKKKLDSGKTITSQDTEEMIKDQERKELLDTINKVADKAIDTDDALEQLEDERIKQIIIDLATEEENNNKINSARATRMAKLQADMNNINIKGKTVKELLETPTKVEPLPATNIPVSGPEKEEWSDMRFINFDKDYDVNSDVIKAINKLSTVQYPMAVRNIDVKDNSTSEDTVDLYTVELEDFRGKRFTIKFDLPKFVNDGNYLFLRGNAKTIQSQLQNMPIIKTDNDTCQIISNYNKIFIRRFGAATGKSNPVASRIIKALNKYEGKDIKIYRGDASKIADKFELPIDYIDIGSEFSKLEIKDSSGNKYIIFFNQEELAKEYGNEINYSVGLPYGVIIRSKGKNEILYYTADQRGGITFSHSLLILLNVYTKFKETYDTVVPTIRCTYSKCSILNTEIPLVVVCAFSEGLENTMRKANIEYELVEKLTSAIRHDDEYDYIKFKDGYVVYKVTYASTLLMNGLKESNTDDYSLADINSKQTYTDFLDNYGGRIKADGLENFYDCEIDPITEEVLEHYKFPTDYVSVLLYANSLLADNKFIKHTDVTSKRLRKKELVAVKVYKALFNDAYASYATQLRHSRNVAQYTIKQSAVIDKFLADSTSSDSSVINAINDVETMNEVTSKGESGMNSDRAYSLDKRTFDDSMLNVVAMSTGFAGNVGITRQATVDMNVEGKRGYVKSIDNDISKLSTTKTLSVTEALNPFGSTCDYPFRTAMTFIQTARHALKTENSDPLLVTNGSDEALPYMVSESFCRRAKRNGVITKYVEGQYIIVQYDDNKEKEYINISKTTEKNSAGGFYVPMQLSAADNIKVGKKVKANDIIAYDKESFDNSLGETDNIAYNVGTLAKVAIINTDEGFEDSAIVTDTICTKMAANITVKEDRILSKDTNIFNLVKVGDKVEDGDTLLLYQIPYDEKDMNVLLKNLTDDQDAVSELGRIPMKSHVIGTVSDIKMYRTVELDELSPSLKKAFIEYEKPIKALKKSLDSEGILSSTLPATYALPATGKLKNAQDSVMIEIFIEIHDIISIGDKIVFDRANKGTVKTIIPHEDAPYTDFRPNEEISAFANVSSFNNRMVTSPMKIGALNKLLIELDRSVKDIMGIKYDDSTV